MSTSVSKVQVLNKKIEDLNTQRTKIETQEEMLKKRLASELADYKEQFGINLTGSSFKETVKKISEEVKKVDAQVEEEYNLKSQVVQLISDGDIAGANKLLGIEDTVEADSSEENEEVEETNTDDLDSIEDDINDVSDDLGVDGKSEDDESDELEDVEDNSDDNFGFDVNNKEPEGTVKKVNNGNGKKQKDEISIDDDDFGVDDVDDDFGFDEVLSGSKFGED